MIKDKEIKMLKSTFLTPAQEKRVPLSYLTMWLLIHIAKCLIHIWDQKSVISKNPQDPLLLESRGSRAIRQGGAISSPDALFTWAAKPFTKFPHRKHNVWVERHVVIL